MTSDAELDRRLLQGKRRALAQLITAAESSRPDDVAWVKRILALPVPDDHAPSLRVAFSGPPGAGKSSLVERLGSLRVAAGQRVAVLALDPTSPKSGGSLLGDRTRMPKLSQDQRAFIRPSPAKTALGGVARSTDLSIALCERAGFDPIFVETVGVGQSEVDVAGLVDCFVLVLTPDAGDDLQALKRGITEAADVVLVNKADLSPDRAEQTRARYESALQLLHEDPPPVLAVSARDGTGLDGLWETITQRHQSLKQRGVLEQRRRERLRAEFRRGLLRRFEESLDEPDRAERLAAIEARLERGETALAEAIDEAWGGRDG